MGSTGRNGQNTALEYFGHTRTVTAVKQASGTWKNPSWDMYCHWAKLVACGMGERCEAPGSDRNYPTPRPSPWPDRRQDPPPFIDPEMTFTTKKTVVKSVLEVYSVLDTTNPKVKLSGYPDIAPDTWESYHGWVGSDINSDMLEEIAKDLSPHSMPRLGELYFR